MAENADPEIQVYRPTLALYAVWHPASSTAGQHALLLLEDCAGGGERLLSRGLDIPVFFRSTPAGEGLEVPLAIPFDAARHSVVILLADAKMVLERDGAWGQYVSNLFAEARKSGGRHRVLPILLDSSAAKIVPGGVQEQGIRAFGQPEDLREVFIHNRIAHELCRLLIASREEEQGSRLADRGASSASVKLFLSHAKADKGNGLERALELKEYIDKQTVFDNFFDANEIAPGHLFDEEIEAHLKDPRATLVVILTDAYASRPWCRREVLIAKRLGRPVVVVHAVRRGEERCFPYLGNVPSLRVERVDEDWGAATCEKVLRLVLWEVLRQNYFERQMNDLLAGVSYPPGTFSVSRPPELLNLLYEPVHQAESSSGKRIGIYPEPPLGSEELDILARLEPNVLWLTPTLLSTIRRFS